jgi:hypothetical protein
MITLVYRISIKYNIVAVAVRSVIGQCRWSAAIFPTESVAYHTGVISTTLLAVVKDFHEW